MTSAAGRAGPGPELSVRAAARDAGSGTALVAGERSWTWAELASDAEDERRRLEEAGFLADPAVPVAFDARPSPDTVIRLLALLEAAVPALPLHPGLPADERAARVRCLDGVDADGPGEAAARSADDPARDRPPGGGLQWETRPPTAESDDPSVRSGGWGGAAAFLFTSGSSGRPRAVELPRSAFLASAAASATHLGWEEDDRWLCCLPLAHIAGLSILTRCLIARRTIVLTPGFDAEAFPAIVERERVTHASVVPTMLHRVLEAGDGWSPPSTLRVMLMGGAAAGAGLWEEIGRRRLPVLETYGMTETCSQVATGRPGAPRRLEPLPGVRVRIREDRVEVAGPMVCARIGRQGDSSEGGRAPDSGDAAFTADGYLRTADLGILEDGVLRVRGRADETIVTGGEKVSPLAVEEVLERHPAVGRAVVFGVPDEEWGEVVVAALERRRDTPPAGPEALRDWMNERLASFQRPRRVAWFATLPETPTGKPDRAATRMAAHSAALDL